MQLNGGRWYARALGLVGAAPGEWAIVQDTYLNQPWCIWHGTWQVFDLDTEVRGLDHMQTAFYMLAFEVGPRWDCMLADGAVSRSTIKGWGLNGATRSLGDVGNQCMHLTLQLVHVVRAQSQEPLLWELASRNHQNAGDQLEAIMGLRDLDPRNYQNAGDVVDTACCSVYNAWYSLAHDDYNVASVAQHLNLAHFVRCRREAQDARAQMRRRFFGQRIYVAFLRKLQGRRSVLQIIVRFGA